MNRAKRMRDYTFRQLRRHARMIESRANQYPTVAVFGRDGPDHFCQTIAEQARKIAVEYARFVALGSYL